MQGGKGMAAVLAIYIRNNMARPIHLLGGIVFLTQAMEAVGTDISRNGLNRFSLESLQIIKNFLLRDCLKSQIMIAL
ncbi:hypothetical protein CFR76_02285 [Komagataeibacter swingsii]|uniref:Uncharacterized protein n=1 Tax=Komagataeibacter swingsii TaxID=215220 RepID=A0A2V4R7K3_9PROT|nr:hypothetical protein CFR76_02285 [Komagataeibacter swingsii]